MIGKNKKIHRFTRGHLYEISLGDRLTICKFNCVIRQTKYPGAFYDFSILSSASKRTAPRLRLLVKTINVYTIKEIQITDLPLYFSMNTFPAMEKVLKTYKT